MLGCSHVAVAVCIALCGDEPPEHALLSILAFSQMQLYYWLCQSSCHECKGKAQNRHGDSNLPA